MAIITFFSFVPRVRDEDKKMKEQKGERKAERRRKMMEGSERGGEAERMRTIKATLGREECGDYSRVQRTIKANTSWRMLAFRRSDSSRLSELT